MLTKIRVRNFKSLKDLTLDLGQRNVLVGANMAGKSNVIDLLKFVHDMTFPSQPGTWALTNAVFARGGFDEVVWKGGNVEVTLIGMSGRDISEGVEWLWDYEITMQGGQPGGNFRVTSEELHARKGESGPTYPLIRTEGFNRYFRDTGGRDLGQTSDQARSMLEFEIPGWKGGLLRSTIAKWRFYELVPSFMRSPNQTAATLFLDKYGQNLSQWLMYLQSRYGDSFARIQTVLRDTLPDVEGLFTSPTQQSTVFLGSHEKSSGRSVPCGPQCNGCLVARGRQCN